MSKRITSYVCINLSCRESTRTHLPTLTHRYTVPAALELVTRKRTPSGRVSVCARGHSEAHDYTPRHDRLPLTSVIR